MEGNLPVVCGLDTKFMGTSMQWTSKSISLSQKNVLNFCIHDLYFRFEGARGFYKGLIPGLLRVTPACCITFVVYENLITYLLHSDR